MPSTSGGRSASVVPYPRTQTWPTASGTFAGSSTVLAGLFRCSLRTWVITGWSLSVMVRVTSAGPSTPVTPATVPDTVITLSSSLSLLPAGVMVTVPVLSVALGAKLRVVLALSLKAESVAGNTAAAETVTVNAVVCGACPP